SMATLSPSRTSSATASRMVATLPGMVPLLRPMGARVMRRPPLGLANLPELDGREDRGCERRGGIMDHAVEPLPDDHEMDDALVAVPAEGVSERLAPGERGGLQPVDGRAQPLDHERPFPIPGRARVETEVARHLQVELVADPRPEV